MGVWGAWWDDRAREEQRGWGSDGLRLRSRQVVVPESGVAGDRGEGSERMSEAAQWRVVPFPWEEEVV